jgi:hypothetical protein
LVPGRRRLPDQDGLAMSALALTVEYGFRAGDQRGEEPNPEAK